MPKKYPLEFKKQIVNLCQSGMPMSEAEKKFNVAISTLYRWLRECGPSPEGHTAVEYSTLLRQNTRSNHLLEIIALSQIIDGTPLRRRLEILAKLHEQFEQYSVHELCEALNVSRGTFYNHIFRRADRTAYFQEQQALMLQVQQVFEDSKQRYGAQKICAVLGECGIHVGVKRIRAIMQELGLESIRQNAKRNYKKRQAYKKQDLLRREFTASRMNEIWVSDITCFKVNRQPMYLCVIIDLFSRRVVSYRASQKQSTQLVTSTFKMAFQERGTPVALTFHSDRGGQYVSGTFRKLLIRCGVTQSFSQSGRPLDNAVSEAFFATFKKEEAYRRDYSSATDFRKSADEYIRFYNEIRPHQTLAYKTPARFEELYGKQKT